MDVFCDVREITLRYGEYVNDVQRLLTFHGLSCGAPEDFGALTVKLDESKAFRADFSTVVRSVHSREQGSMSADQMLTILALGSGGPLVVSGRVASAGISRTVAMLGMLLAGVGTWAEVGGVARAPEADAPNNTSGPAHDRPYTPTEPSHFERGSIALSHSDASELAQPTRDPLESTIQEMIIQLGSIQSRMGRLEQVVDQDLHAFVDPPGMPDGDPQSEEARRAPVFVGAPSRHDVAAPISPGRSLQEAIASGVSVTGIEREQAGIWNIHEPGVADGVDAMRPVDIHSNTVPQIPRFESSPLRAASAHLHSHSSAESPESRTAVLPRDEFGVEPLEPVTARRGSALDGAIRTDRIKEASRISPPMVSEPSEQRPGPISAAEKRRQENLYRALANLDSDMKGRSAARTWQAEAASAMRQTDQDRKNQLGLLVGSAAMILVIFGAILVGRSRPSAGAERSDEIATPSVRDSAGESMGQSPLTQSAPLTAPEPLRLAAQGRDDARRAPGALREGDLGTRGKASRPVARVAGKRMQIARKDPDEEDLHPEEGPALKDAGKLTDLPTHSSAALEPRADTNQDRVRLNSSESAGPLTVLPAAMEKKLVSARKPVYPAEALNQHLDGTVVLNAYIARDGTVRRMDVLQGPPIFLKSAMAAVSWRRYKPYRVNGRPVEVITQVTVKYPPR